MLRWMRFLLLPGLPLLAAVLLAACGGDTHSSSTSAASTGTTNPARITADAPHPPVQFDTWAVQFNAKIPAAPRQRIEQHLQALGYRVVVLDDGATAIPESEVLWLIGTTPLQQALSPAELANTSESFQVQTLQQGNQQIYLSRGNDGAEYDLTPTGPQIGDLYAAYALLESLGMRFLHPLQPTVAPQDTLPIINATESPHWPIRTWHIHTQHPLELTHVLNGWGPNGPDDAAGWQALLPEWERFLEWAVANRQNRVEWFLLMAESWQTFADSTERQQRLLTLVQMAHDWGLAVGIDAPIAFRQQHAWIMLREKGNETAQIHSAIDWLMAAGFDYLEIEMGYSEFTHPSAEKMLEWMNTATRYTASTYGKPTYVKVHCSQEQVAKNFQDPDTGAPLNFNFLPYYADPALGVMPHTVQYYDLQGPAYTYGNTNFHDIRRYMQLEAGRREVLYYPETAYWVNFDIDVPLFLPLYAATRLQDLRLIATDEIEGRMGRGEFAGSRIQGQANFSSGWEWGYWLNDVVTARAAWNPLLHYDDVAALHIALLPFTSLLGTAQQEASDLLRAWIDANRDLLWYGTVASQTPEDGQLRNAQAYLQGWDTWSEVSVMLGQLETQPAKMGIQDMTGILQPRRQKIPYRDLQALLEETTQRLDQISKAWQELAPQIPTDAEPLYNEITDAMSITALRAEQVYNLYQTVASQSVIILNDDKTAANRYLNQARDALDAATQIVARREAHYRADPDRIANWGYNPTAYNFGYLWTVHSLYFWWRDEGRAVDRPVSPSYLNIKDPVDIANGEGEWKESVLNLTWLRQRLAAAFKPGNWWEEMLFEPSSEPEFPPEGLRQRPTWYNELP